MKLTCKRRSAGFVLVEALFAVTIFGVGITAVLASYNIAYDLVRANRFYIDAVRLSAEKMSEIEKEVLLGIHAGEGRSTETVDGAFSRFSLDTQIVSSDIEGLYTAIITLQDSRQAEGRSFVLRSYVVKGPWEDEKK